MNPLTFSLIWNAEKYMLPCINKEFFGVDCPGCGLQRAAVYLYHGEFAKAFYMYPAIYPILLLLLVLLLDTFFKFRYTNQVSIGLMVTTVIFILANYALKFI